MRSLSSRVLFVFLAAFVTTSAFAHDVTLSGTTSFAAIDGSASDHDGASNGVFTVSDGNLIVNGVVNCNDDTTVNACAMAFAVSGNMTVNSGGALYAENRSGGGTGGAITLTVGGNLTMNGSAIVSTASQTSSGATGGAITATVSGNVSVGTGSTIDSGSSNARGGDINIASAGLVSIDGNILSGPSRTILSTRLTGVVLDGGTANQIGGKITISSNTFAEPAMVIGGNANIVSQGDNLGAGPVTIDGCGIQVRGLVAALSRKDSAAKVAIRSGKDVVVDGRDLGVSGAPLARYGRVRADAPSGTAAAKGVDIFATETIDLYGPASGTLFAITSLPGLHDSKSYGGLIRVLSTEDAVNASGNVIDDGHTASGDTGGSIEISAKGTVNLNTAVIRAVGDFNTNNANRGGGSIHVRSYSGNVVWTNGTGEVRPVGSTSNLPLADQGSIVLTACGTINTTGSSFPVMGTATSVFPETHTGVCSPAAPSLPAGVPALVTCNTPPVANDTSATTNEDTTVTITLTGSDADGDPITFTIVSGPSNGSLGAVISTGPTSATVDYTPNLNYNGADSFVFRANDGNGGTDDAVASITITPVNDPPTFTVGSPVTVFEDSGAQTFTGWATGITAGPADESGQTVTFTVTNSNPALFSVQPAVSSNGTLTFTPAANANGSATLTVTAKDNGGTANGGNDTSASQTSSITVTAVNDEPSFVKGADQTVNEDAGPQTVSPWATAISAGPNESGQTVTFVTSNNNNALFSVQPAVSSSGTLTYTPAANANGTATVTVYAQDDGGTANGGDDTSASQTFTITVTAVNDAPSFTSGGDVSVDEDSGAYSAGWATDISAGPADESGQTVSFNVSNSNNSLFSAQPSISASGVLSFTLAANQYGSATVTVTLSDNGGTANGGADTSAAQTFTITVDPVNDEPSFTGGGNVTVNEDSAAYAAAWASAISAGPNESGQTLTFVVSNDNNSLFSTQPSISASGVLSFALAANQFGSATVSVYLMDDGGTANGGDDTSATQTFTITVNPVNDAPSFTSGGNVTVLEDSAAYSAAWAPSVSAGPANESGQTVTFNVSNSNNALFSVQPSISPSGALSFTVAPNAYGTATVTVTLSDDGGTANGGVDTSAPQTFTITITPVNDAPSFSPGGNVTVNEDSGPYAASWATAISAGPNESGQTVSFNVSNSNNGLFAVQPSISSTGVLSFTPALNAFGSATVTVSLSDNGGTANGGVDTSAPVTFTITVNGVNDPPSAGNDSWQTFGNTELRVDLGAGSTPNVADTTTSGTGVLDNDADNVENDPFAITGIVGCADVTAPFDCNVTGGFVSLNANGTFRFLPSPNATTGSFQYTVTDMPGAGSPASANGTVSISMVEMVWYVNGSAAAGGNGTSSSPYNSLAPLDVSGDPDTANDYIFVHNSNVLGPIALEAGQKLWGEGIGLILPFNLNGNGSPAVLVPAGTHPNVTSSVDTVSVDGVTGTEIAGLAITSTGGDGIDVNSNIAGTAVGTSIYSNIINATGIGIDVNGSSAAASSVSMNNNVVTAAGNGIDVTSVGTTSVSLTAATVTSTSGNGIRMAGAGGSLTITGFGNINVSGNTALDGIRIGTATFSGVSTGTVSVGASGNPVGQAGLVLTTVSGSLAFGTLNVYGGTSGVTITGAPGFTVTSGGGVINNGNGVGLSVSGATIGAANLTFTSITSAGGANGILLNNTGTSGGLKVVGTGAAGSGGSITGKTGDGVSLTTTERVGLAWMNISGSQSHGIGGNGVKGFTVANCTITGNGTSAVSDHSGIYITGLTGTNGGTHPTSISNSTISNNFEFEVYVTNSAGTLANLQMTNNNISSNGATGSHGNLVTVLGSSTADITLNVSGGTYTGNAPTTATGVHADTSGGNLVANVSGATFTNNNVAVNVSVASAGNLTFDLDGNTATGNRSSALNLFINLNHTGTTSGKFRNNIIGTTGVVGSGSALGSGITVSNEGLTNATLLIDNNTMTRFTSFPAITVNAGISTSVQTGTTAVTVTNNTISNVGNRAILVQQNVGKGTICADIANNSMSAIAGSAGDGTKIRIRQLAGGTFRVKQKQATAAADPLELDDANSVGANVTTAAQISASGTFVYNAGGCAQP